MNRKKKRTIYIAAWAVVLAGLLILALLTFGYEDDKDSILAIMVIAVPMGILLLDLFNFARYDKTGSHSSYVVKNFLLVLVAAFVAECIVIIAGFGLKNPQYKLFYTFAIGGALASALLSLPVAIPYSAVSKTKNEIIYK